MLKGLMIVMKKELKRVFTDRRLVLTNFLLPMISIAMMYSVMGFMIQKTSDDIGGHTTRVLGYNTPAAVVALFESEPGFEFLATTGEIAQIEAQLLAGEADFYISFEGDFEDKLKAAYVANPNGQPQAQPQTLPVVTGRYASKHDYAMDASYKVAALLEKYKRQVLIERLGTEDLLTVFTLDSQAIAIPKEDQGIDSSFANLIPMLISVFIFSGAMSIGMDAIAGEKERGTIATMLVTPVDRTVIIGGKMLSLAVVSLISTLSSLIGVMLSIPFSAQFLSTSGELSVSSLTLSPGDMGLFLLAMLGLVGIYVTVISVLSMIANSVKEAGAYMTPAYMVVMMTAFVNMFGGNQVSSYLYYVPVYNNLVNMKQILTGDADPMMVMVSVGTSLALTLILIAIARVLIHQEKVVFPS